MKLKYFLQLLILIIITVILIIFYFSFLSEKNDKNKIWSGTKGSKIFLLKWGISYKFFKKYFLKSNTKYIGELPIKPNYTLNFVIDFIICKFNYYYLKYIYSYFNKKA